MRPVYCLARLLALPGNRLLAWRTPMGIRLLLGLVVVAFVFGALGCGKDDPPTGSTAKSHTRMPKAPKS
jgi:hypothetical protein